MKTSLNSDYRQLFICAVFSLLMFACGTEKSKEAQPNHDFEAFLDAFYESRFQYFPFEAMFAADHRFNHLLPLDISEAFRADLGQFYQSQMDQLLAFDLDQLSENDRISYLSLEWDLSMGLEELKFDTHLLPINQFFGMHLDMAQLGSGKSSQPFRDAQDYHNFMERLEKFTVWMDTARVNFKKGIQKGQVWPKAIVIKMIPQLEELGSEDKSVFYEPLNNFPDDIPQSEQAAIGEAYTSLLKEKVFPAYRKMADFLKQDYLPNAKNTAGITDFTDGKAWYVHQVKYWTTTDMLPDEIFELGKAEVARIREEMEKIRTSVGFEGSLEEFFQYINSDSKFYPFTSAEAVLDFFRDIEARIEPQLLQYFKVRPQAEFEVRRTESFREATASAEYEPAAPDGSRPGVFYVPIPDYTRFNLASGMESLFLHEAIPGHHYQFALQMENDDLPKFRKFGWYGAYGEGWALYCESLGKELGLYTDPYQYFGALGDEMHRAIRLVVDVGIHHKGWTREVAIGYMMDNEQISEYGATAEIERYMVMPAQALSYKIGQLKILELREKYENLMGDQFDMAAFHDQILRYGGVPLDVLEKNMDLWAGIGQS